MPTVVAKVPVFVRVKDTLIRIILARCSKKTGQMQHLVWAGGRPRDPRKRNRMNLMSPGSAARPAVTESEERAIFVPSWLKKLGLQMCHSGLVRTAGQDETCT